MEIFDGEYLHRCALFAQDLTFLEILAFNLETKVEVEEEKNGTYIFRFARRDFLSHNLILTISANFRLVNETLCFCDNYVKTYNSLEIGNIICAFG